MPNIILETRADGVAIVTLNRPDAMNALSTALRAELADAMAAIRDDDSVRAVVLTGAGDRAFTAGLDLKELSDAPNLGAANDQDPRSNPCKAIESCAKPVIGAVNGVAVTGGLEVALACTMLIASTNARFADTHALVGIMPGWGLSQKLQRIVGVARAKEMSFSGRFVDAQTAYDWGLVNRVVAPEHLLSEACALAAQIASVERDFLQQYETLMDEGYNMAFDAALAHEVAVSTPFNRNVTPQSIAQRREGVMQRGRKQV